MRLTVLSIFFGLSTLAAHCQYFTDLGFSIGLDVHVFDNLHGAGVSFVDFNQDGWDDLTFCEDGVIKFYANNQGQATLQDLGISVQENAKHPIWVDFDNDGDLDFFITQKDFPNRLFECNPDGSFTDITVQAGFPLFDDPSYGASWADYDNDGDLDVYVCNYVYLYTGNDEYQYYNHLYRNNGDGTFSDVTEFSVTSDGISLSFQSVWFDADNDGFQDLFVINDLEHANRLYHNNGDGTFSDISEASGLDLPIMDAMSASVGDFNNDGLFDLFITNVAIQSCALMINNGDLTFANIANASGTTINQLCWGALWLDYDYDRDQDLYVCENHYAFPDQHNPLLRNDGDNTFTNIGASNLLFDQTNSYCCAKGDWNNDGFLDIAVNNWEWNNASLWENSGAAYNPVLVSLEGVYSNKMGVGAEISVWVDGIPDKRLHKVGENYMGQNSLVHRFGTAGHNQLDSLVIAWPSGIKDVILNPTDGSNYHVVEGSMWSADLEIPPSMSICEGDSLSLSLDSEWDISWGDGTEETEVMLGPGSHLIVVHHPLGPVDSIQFLVQELQFPAIESTIVDVSCAGENDGSILVSTPSLDSLVWSDTTTGFGLQSLNGGWYSFTAFLNGCSFSDSLLVHEPQALSVESEHADVLCFGEENGVHLISQVSGGVPPYFDLEFNEISSWPFGSSELPAGESQIELYDSNGCSWLESVQIDEPMQIELEAISDCENGLSIDLAVTGGVLPHSFEWSNGSIAEDIVSDEAMCLSVVVSDANQCTVSSEDWCCETSVSDLEVNIWRVTGQGADGIIDLEYYGSGVALVRLIDVSGRLVWETEFIGQNAEQIEVDKAGVYLLVLHTSKVTFTRKLGLTP